MDAGDHSTTLTSVLRIRAIRHLWLAQLISICGDFLTQFAVLSVVTFSKHGTAAAVILVFFCYLVPVALVTPLAGAVVDKYNPRHILIGSDIARAVLVLLFFLVSDLASMCCIIVAIGTISAFFLPAQSIAIKQLSPDFAVRNANILMEQAFVTMQILGPLIAGALIAAFGQRICFGLDAGSYLVSAGFLSTLSLQREQREAAASSLVRDVYNGLVFVLSRSDLRFVFGAGASAMFVMRCFGGVIPIYVRDELGGNTRLFGLSAAALGMGMFAGNLLISKVGRQVGIARLMSMGLLGIAAGIILIAAIRSPGIALMGILSVGLFFSFLIAPANTYIQQVTPSSLLGRARGSMLATTMGAQVAGLAVAGRLTGSLGVDRLYLLCGACAAAIGGWGLAKSISRSVAGRKCVTDTDIH